MTRIPPAPTQPKLRKLRGARARSVEDKDLRRSHLVQAAADLFAQNSFGGVTIAQLAQRAGVAKGTAYLYFSCKEAVFLELAQRELRCWESDLGQSLNQPGEPVPPMMVPVVMARTLAQRPTLCRLLVLLHAVIEPQLNFETALTFKRFLRDSLTALSELLTSKVPGLGQEQAANLILQTHALVISLTQLSSPPPIICRVLESDATLQSMRIEFEPFLADTLSMLLRGALQKPI